MDVHDVTTFGNQFYGGNARFSSTETTNGGSFTVTGTTTLGNSTTISTGAGAATLTGTVNATTAGVQGLTVNSGGVTTFGSSVGNTAALASLTTDAGGTSQIGGNVTTTGGQSFNDPTSATATNTTSATQLLTSTNGGAIAINNATATFPSGISTTGDVSIISGNTLGSVAAPLALSTPNNIIVQPAIPTGLFFTTSNSFQPPNLTIATGTLAVQNGATIAQDALTKSAADATSTVQASAGIAVAEASKAGFDTDSVAQQINYGFVGDVGVAAPMDHRIDETGLSVPEGFGDEGKK
jgi:hypothetical protein